MCPSPSIVMMQSKAALRIARLARLALAHAALGAAALDELADLRAQAGHRGQQLVVGRDAGGGEELHDAEHLPGAADREGEGGVQAGGVGGLGARQRARSARRRRRSRPACPSATPRRAGPGRTRASPIGWPRRRRATRRRRRPPTCARSAGTSPSASTGVQRAPKSQPSAAPMAASRRGCALSSSGAEASTRATACSVRRSTATSDRSLRWDMSQKGTASLPHPVGARTCAHVGRQLPAASSRPAALGHCPHARRPHVRRDRHPRGHVRTLRRRDAPAPALRAGAPADDVEPAPDARQLGSTSPARPLPITATKPRAGEPHLGVGAQQPGDGRGVGGGHARRGRRPRSTTRLGLQRRLQRGVQRLARGQVELAAQLDHRGHAHPVHGAPEQRADRSWDLVTVDAHR